MEAIAPEMIVAQVRAVAEDIGVDAVKIGMLGTAATVDAVVEALGLVGEAPVVVDPVMVAESGASLLDDAAREALVERLLPLAAVATPNIPEARGAGRGGEGDSQEELARAVLALGPRAVVVTGGHSERERRPLLRRPGRVADRGRAPSRRRLARLRLHAFLGARRAPGARRHAARGRAQRARGSPRRRSAPASASSARAPGR